MPQEGKSGGSASTDSNQRSREAQEQQTPGTNDADMSTDQGDPEAAEGSSGHDSQSGISASRFVNKTIGTRRSPGPAAPTSQASGKDSHNVDMSDPPEPFHRRVELEGFVDKNKSTKNTNKKAERKRRLKANRKASADDAAAKYDSLVAVASGLPGGNGDAADSGSGAVAKVGVGHHGAPGVHSSAC